METTMSENTNEVNGEETKVNAGPFNSESDAQANKPVKGKARLFAVTKPDGTKCWCWANGSKMAIGTAAKAAGYKASEQGKSNNRVKTLLDDMSEEDRAILIAQYAPAPKPSGKKGK